MSEIENTEVVDAAFDVVNKDEIAALEIYDRAALEAKLAAEELAKKNEKLEAAKSAVKSHWIAKIKEQIVAFGIEQGDLFDAPIISRKPRKASRPPVEAKYRGPKGEEWSGRGLTPRWLKSLIAEGRTQEEFLTKIHAA